MIITTTTKVILNDKELETLRNANKILEVFQTAFDENDMLSSPTTGEVVELSELPRVRGILSALTDSNMECAD